jgi:hypothetical protein
MKVGKKETFIVLIMLTTVILEIYFLYPFYPVYVELPWDIVKRYIGIRIC